MLDANCAVLLASSVVHGCAVADNSSASKYKKLG